jgi:hypothetical protein
MTKVAVLFDADGVFGLYEDRAAAVVALGEAVLEGLEFEGVQVEEFEIQPGQGVAQFVEEVDAAAAAGELTQELQTVYAEPEEWPTYNGLPFIYDKDGDRWERNCDGTYSCPGEGLRELHYSRVANLFGPLTTTDPNAA